MLSGRQVVLQARKHHKIASICERLADELDVPKVMLVYKGEVLAGGPAELRHYYIYDEATVQVVAPHGYP